MRSMFKIVSRGMTGPRAMLALVGILSLVSGFALAADTDIVITEIMNNPDVLFDSQGEWFEIHNTGGTPVDLNGWTIQDNDTDLHVILGSAVVPGDGYAVLGIDAVSMAGEGVTLLYQYADIALANGGDELVLLNGSAVEIDRVEWDGGPVWPDLTGASMMWDEASGDNNVGGNWSPSTTVFGSGDLGTPGASNGGALPQPPSISDVYHRSLLPEPSEPVTVFATIMDNDGTITSATLFVQVNGGGFIGSPMTIVSGDQYSGAIAAGSNGDAVDYYVSATDNNSQTTTNPGDAPTSFYSYTVAPEVITPIASIQNDFPTYEDTIVMVQAQVYIPGNYKADGSISAYIQDGSGRGINIFGTTRSTGGALLNDVTAIVKVSGRVDLYFTTVELVNYEVELVSISNPELTPDTQTTGNAAAPTNEGTYIHSQGLITATGPPVGGAYNFTVDDGSGNLVIRVDEDLVLGMDTWLVGDLLEGSGAGSTYNSQGQLLVGMTNKVTNHGQGPDLTPPLLVGAALTTPTTVTLSFNEALDPTTASTAGNYEVYETATPGNTIAVLTAVLQGNTTDVLLTLAGSASGTPHTVRVNNVEDVAGNPIAANTTMEIFEAGGPIDIVINEVMRDPFVLADSVGEWFEVYNNGASPVDMNGWTIRDDDFNSHVINNGAPLIIGAGEYKVFCRNAAAMAGEGVSVFYEYPAGFTLGNGEDELIIETGAVVVVDAIAWDDGTVWPDQAGFSMQWTGAGGDNNNGSTWEDIGGPSFGSNDRGTPGAVNDWVSSVPGAGLKTAMDPNYPNPFNPRTSFSFSLDRTEQVTLAVYDVRGNRVATVVESVLPAGRYDQQFSWDGMDDRGVPANSGTYFYRLTTASGFSQTGKMTLLK